MNTEVFVGVFDLQVHTIPQGVHLNEYPPPPAGPGGRWAFAQCGQPAWEIEAALRSYALKRLVDCVACAGSCPPTTVPAERRVVVRAVGTSDSPPADMPTASTTDGAA